MYCARSRENARLLYADAVRDVNDIFAAFERWGNPRHKWLSGLNWGRHVINRVLSDGIAPATGPYKKVSEAPKEVGIGDDFSVHNKILCQTHRHTFLAFFHGRMTSTKRK
jgi:hypothetical protein